MSSPQDSETLRTAEVIAPVCLATDLGMGFPLEHGLHATLIATRFCDILEVDLDTTNQVYYGSMLMYAGCTTDAALGSWDGQSVLRRARGGDIPLAVRIFILARDMAFQRHLGGESHAGRKIGIK